MSIGQRIKQRRKQLNITQQELAEMLNTNQNQVWRYENGKNDPTGAVIVILATILGTSTDWLLGRTDIIDEVRGESTLTEAEKLLLELYREKNPDQQRKLVEVAKVI